MYIGHHINKTIMKLFH